ncbi:MAG: replicative helicase, partial [Actinomycetota bacterium]
MSIAEFPRGDRAAAQQKSVNRIPPHSVEAEASLLGAMLLSRDAVAIAFERGVRSEEFYKPAHQHIYDAIRSLNTAGEPIDPITVGDELRRNNLLDGIGGI